jgi:hypothetical protein
MDVAVMAHDYFKLSECLTALEFAIDGAIDAVMNLESVELHDSYKPHIQYWSAALQRLSGEVEFMQEETMHNLDELRERFQKGELE